MKFPLLPSIWGALAAASLLGCGSDDTVVTPQDDGGGFEPTDGLPADTATADTSVATDTGSVATDTGSPPADTGAKTDGATMTTAMKCGAVTCDSNTQDCCSIGGVGSCTTKGGACSGIRYSCTSVDNCGAGQVCCVSGAGAGGASCTTAASCPTSTTCKTSADCSGKLKNCVDIGFTKICST